MRILLVEDDSGFREVYQHWFSLEFNCSVETAASGTEAINILNQESSFQAIICDYFMRDGTGQDVLNYLATSDLTVPIIIFSGTDKLNVETDYPHFKGVVSKAEIEKVALFLVRTDKALGLSEH